MVSNISKVKNEDSFDHMYYDDSTVINSQTFNLKDGREVKAELWCECGYTFLTYYFSTAGIENFSKERLTDYLIEKGIKIDKDEFGDKIDVSYNQECKIKKLNIQIHWLGSLEIMNMI